MGDGFHHPHELQDPGGYKDQGHADAVPEEVHRFGAREWGTEGVQVDCFFLLSGVTCVNYYFAHPRPYETY